VVVEQVVQELVMELLEQLTLVVAQGVVVKVELVVLEDQELL
tara:strand:- start:53 stop:178 length:126 start_codon:yes stop_codon:yes gene_type:complete